MSALEIRLIAYAVALVALLGATSWETWRLTADHYQAVHAKELKAAQDALEREQAHTIEVQNQQAAITANVGQRYEALQADRDRLARQFADSVRAFAAAAGHPPAPEVPGAPGGDYGPGGRPDPADELAALAGAAHDACLKAGDELTAAQDWIHQQQAVR